MLNGLFVYIDNDAEQICYEVRTAGSLSQQANYFGIFSRVADNSKLLRITNSDLGKIEFGYGTGQSLSEPLLLGMKLKFDSVSLVFVNNCDFCNS